MILLKNYFVDTTEDIDLISIIHEINRSIRESKITDGLATIVVPSPGGALLVAEPLPEVIEGLKGAIRVFPGEGTEAKNRKKEEFAIWPRVAASMIGKTLAIPFAGGKLVLGAREEVLLVDLETTGRRREFYVQASGEAPQQDEPQRGAAPRRR
jgi:thiamine phosphate synthase YjbQ (UPF0047 family)